MSKYTVQIAFDQYQIGDKIKLNPRQAKYKLLSGHIVALPAEAVAEETPDVIEFTDVNPET
jgi:hypothetical protein